MVGLNQSIVVKTKDLNAQLDRIMAAVSSQVMDRFFKSDIEEWFVRRGRMRLQAEGDDASGKWRPLKASTIRLRRTKGFGPGPINRRTGQMDRWLLGGNLRGGPIGDGVEYKFPGDPPTGELLTKVARAQLGDYRTVPRPILAINETDLETVMRKYMNFIEDQAQ
jgi:hypothetical protein